jgi:hypothetical protein
MSHHWRIKLVDEHGTYWLTDREKMWSDDVDHALQFTCWRTAYQSMQLAQSRVEECRDEWVARVKCVKFKD